MQHVGSDEPPATVHAPYAKRSEGRGASFTSLPDEGELMVYPVLQVTRHAGAYTWHRADLSEAHAIHAIVDGKLRLTTPSGQHLEYTYQRHVEHADGNWTWIGRLAGHDDQEAIITFGDHAAFGTFGQSGEEPLQLTMRDGVTWLMETDRSQLRQVEESVQTRQLDYLLPPQLTQAVGRKTGISTAAQQTQSATATPAVTVDVVLGYTTGFAASLGGQSQAVTRLEFLVDVTNQAYANSLIDSQIRLVHTLVVDYPDATDNGDALEKLTGYEENVGPTTPDPAFSELRAARDQYGGDVVSLVRKFQTPENVGCGIAWLIGGEQSTIDAGSEPFGYSVVSDGIDVDEGDGFTYSCRLETLAHEFGHNMGQAHNSEDSSSTGAHAYSYGYREASSSGFYTVMAYRLSNSSQYSIRYFANPNVSYEARPTGVENASDNARSMLQTMPIIASFQATVVPEQSPLPTPALYGISKLGASGYTEIHTLSGQNNFQSFTLHLATALHSTGSDSAWEFQFGDYNHDGALDLYSIAKMGASGQTEVHVLSGADGYRTFLAHIATALHQTGSADDWEFRLSDYNYDGQLDLYVLKKMGTSGQTELHVLDGANNFQSFLANLATALHQTGNDNAWQFELGDLNHDNILDLYCISKLGASGTTEVHVLDGASNFQSFLLHQATALHQTGSDHAWEFKLGDFNLDGTTDVYAIGKLGASGQTEVHVLDGASQFQAFSAHIATALHSTGADSAWEFELAPE